MRYKIIPHDHPKYSAIKHRLLVTWLKTLFGYVLMGILPLLAFWAFGSSYEFKLGFGTLWLLLPVVLWWFSDKIALRMAQAIPADPGNPLHKRWIDIVDQAYAKSNMKHKPRIYISPMPVPNAFATGPIHRKAVVVATELLLQECDMSNEEIEGVAAHELGHVRNYDVAINSFLTVISSLFFLIVNDGINLVLGSLGWIKKSLGLRPERRFLPAILTNLIMFAIFWITGQVTRVIQLFVVRSRESCADATASMTTGNPCHLASALLKLVAYMEKRRPEGQDRERMRALRPCMLIDPLFDSTTTPPRKKGIWEAIKRFWRTLQLTHPPVPERVAELERMNGGQCPRP